MYNTGFERFESVPKAYCNVIFVGHAQTWWGHISAELDPNGDVPNRPGKSPGGLTDRLLSDYENIYGDLSVWVPTLSLVTRILPMTLGSGTAGSSFGEVIAPVATAREREYEAAALPAGLLLPCASW
jgi:hypothetical protein